MGHGTFTRSFEYDTYENISSIVSGEWRQSFNFDGASGNLMSRSYMNGDSTFMRTENFQYDTRERLTTSQVTGQSQKVVTYDQTGNILTKTDAGTYYYNSDKVNALRAVTLSYRSGISTDLQTIAYNSQNKATAISEDVNSYSIVYGADGERIKSQLYNNSVLSKTKYYAPGYEKITTTGGTVENHYISSPFSLEAIIVKAGASETMYLSETDHLGSLTGLRDTSGVYVEKYSYDAWGRRRNPTDWSFNSVPAASITDRGFTGHEHLDIFRLINMNGRLYDPVTGRFLNADPVIDNTGGAQGLNSYTYCMNNPLKFTDPSGYIKAAPQEEMVILNPGWLKYAGYEHYSSSWFDQEYVESSGGGGGGGMYGKPGQGGNGTGLGGIYYDNVSGNYRDVNTYKAVSQEVFINVIESYRDNYVTWLYYSGSVDNPYARLTGFSLSDGTRVDFIDNNNGQGGESFSLANMYMHFQVGGGSPMTLNMSSVDFGGATQKLLGLTGMKPGDKRGVNLFNAGPLNQAALAFGNVNMMYHGNNQFSIVGDESSKFNFWPLIGGSSLKRDAGNILGFMINYNLFPGTQLSPLVPLIFGGEYPVNFIGTTYIPK